MVIVTDLDGTLVDTREAVLAAYREVGVEPPPGAWGRPWREWLDDISLHRRKNEIYPRHLHERAKALPALKLVQHAANEGARVIVLTAASEDAALVVFDRFHIVHNARLYAGLSLERRVEIAASLRREHTEPVIYLDDDAANVAAVAAVCPEWVTCLV